MELNRLHIAFGAPSYEVITKASVRPRLTKAGINEALSGKRLPSIDSLLEFVGVVSNPLPPPADAPAPRCRPDLADAWRARWQEVKFTQRRAQAGVVTLLGVGVSDGVPGRGGGGFRLCSRRGGQAGDSGDLLPDCEADGHFGSVVVCGDQMAAGSEVGCDAAERG